MREVKDERPGVLHVGMPLGKYLRRYCPADWQTVSDDIYRLDLLGDFIQVEPSEPLPHSSWRILCRGGAGYDAGRLADVIGNLAGFIYFAAIRDGRIRQSSVPEWARAGLREYAKQVGSSVVDGGESSAPSARLLAAIEEAIRRHKNPRRLRGGPGRTPDQHPTKDDIVEIAERVASAPVFYKADLLWVAQALVSAYRLDVDGDTLSKRLTSARIAANGW